MIEIGLAQKQPSIEFFQSKLDCPEKGFIKTSN
jgi:hypothetical protein